MSDQIQISKIIVDEPPVYRVTNNAVYEVNPCIESLTNNSVNAYTQQQFNNVGFKIDAMGSNMLVKPNITFKFQLKMLAKLLDTRSSDWSTTLVTDDSMFAMSQFSLYRLCTNLNIIFNNVTYSLASLDRIINALSYYDSLEHLSGNSVQPDNGAIANFSELFASDSVGARNEVNPFLPYGYSSKFISRNSYVTVNKTYTTTTNTYQNLSFTNGYSPATAQNGFAYQMLDANIELNLPLELFSDYGAGFGNISSLQFDFTFNSNLSKLISYNNDAMKSTTTSGVTTYLGSFDSISFAEFTSTPTMYYYRVSMPDNLIKSLSTNGVMQNIPYRIPKFNVVTTSTENVKAGNPQSFNFNSNTYSHIPKKIFVFFLKNYQNNATNSLYSSTPANFGLITNFELKIDNQTLQYSSAEDMYNLAQKNWINTSYCNKYQWVEGYVGSILCIDVNEDIGVPGGYTGKTKVCNIACTATVKNVGDEAVNFSGTMVFVNDNTLILGPNNASIKEGLDIDQLLTEVIDKDRNDVARSVVHLGGKIVGGALHGAKHVGGSFWDSIKSGIGKVARFISTISPAFGMVFPEFGPIIGAVGKLGDSVASHLGAGIKHAAKSSKIKFKGI